MDSLTYGCERRSIVKFTAALAIGLCLIASTGHAQGWAQAIIGLGAFSQGVQNGEAQRYNMQRGYPAQIQSYPYGGQSQPTYFNFNGRIITCLPLGNGSTYCQ
jgi:hypothetical protein